MSRFVSAGTNEEPIVRDDEWKKAQQELDEARLRKIEESKQEGGKSLYEVLQANKAAKQDAFEEKIRLKNQFRALDTDEVEFLDAVLESTRAKEAAVKKETLEHLEVFRRQQAEAAKSAVREDESGSPPIEEEVWSTRKRKKDKEPLLNVKLRKVSSSSETILGPSSREGSGSDVLIEQTASRRQIATIIPSTGKQAAPSEKVGLGLGGYSSDDD